MTYKSSSTACSTSSPCIKLRFFSRIRRLLLGRRNKRSPAPPPPIIHDDDDLAVAPRSDDEAEAVLVLESEGRDDDVVAGLQRAVKRLHFGGCWAEKEAAAAEIEAALAKDDVRLSKLMAQLGVVPVLVTMAASDVAPRRRTALAALIHLANATYTNKALVVEAGILSKLPKSGSAVDEATKSDFSELLLTLSSLANTTFPLSTSEIVPFVIGLLESNTTSIDTKHTCLATLHNLSTVLDNAGVLVSNGAVDTLLKHCSTKELSDNALATLGSLVVTMMGKKAMENSPMVPQSLIQILTWDDKPKCQESSAYILMILAHQSSAQRQKMAKLGIVSALLEVALLSSPLAQKRALKLLQWFRDERQTRMGPHSGPQAARIATMGSPVNGKEAQQGKKMMNSLVKQSLQKNMELITRRANAAAESCTLKSLVMTASSKSLPY